MQSLVTNRDFLMRLASATQEEIESGALEALAQKASLESTEAPVHPDAVANALAGALDWARLDRKVSAKDGVLEAVEPGAEKIPYIPNPA